MTIQSGYPAARSVAPVVAAHLAERRAAAMAGGLGGLAPLPSVAEIEALVDAAFWASLQREEGQAPRISLALVPPATSGQAMRFAQPLALDPRGLARLSPAVERPGIHLGVWADGDGMRVWGTARSVPSMTLVLEVVEPGLLVLKYRRGDELDKFGTVAVLEGDRVQVVDEEGASIPDCPALLASLLGFQAPATAVGPTGVLVQLAISMRAHRRGGSLIVVPSLDSGWKASVSQPIPYLVKPFAELAELMASKYQAPEKRAWRESLHRAVDAVAGLTAVDGATVLDAEHRLLAFGVKLVRKRASERVEQVAITAPVLGNAAEVVDPSRLGGTRHLSAAQFVHDQRDALAMVASQDGRFTVFAWSPCENMVHAHRIETLLM